MKFDSLKNRIAALENRIIEALPPWPPTEGSFSYCLWQKLGKPGERHGFMEMYKQRAADFWRDQNGK